MLNILIGLVFLVFLLGLYFLFYKKQMAPVENKPLNPTKIDLYFEELFARLDQNKIAIEAEKDHSSKGYVNPINDMAEFLKSNLSTANDWASFEQYFEKVHKDFFKNLKSDYPTISTNELNMCALLKLNIRNKDIAQIMGISPIVSAKHKIGCPKNWNFHQMKPYGILF